VCAAENICLDPQSKIMQLKFIDFGSSQMANEHIAEGLTNEYLSPESCDAILKVAARQLPLEQGKLGPGTDVWATALSLLYCLLGGYHVMIYLCTGKTHYEDTDPKELNKKRINCLFKVCFYKNSFK
jgi:serine/threonine protein kinase